MFTRGKFIVAMVRKDKGQLNIKRDTRIDPKVSDIDNINNCKENRIEPVFKKAESTHTVIVQNNIGNKHNYSNEKKVATGLHEQNIDENINIQCHVTPPSDVQSAKGDTLNTIVTSDYEKSFQSNSGKPEEATAPELIDVFPAYGKPSSALKDTVSGYILTHVSSFDTALESVSKKAESSHTADYFQNNISNNTCSNEKRCASIDLQEHDIIENFNTKSRVTPPADLKHAKGYTIVTSDSEESFQSNGGRAEEATVTELINRVPAYEESSNPLKEKSEYISPYVSLFDTNLESVSKTDNIYIADFQDFQKSTDPFATSDQSSDSFRDSESDYIPPSASSFETDLGFSSDSNQGICDQSKEQAVFNELGQVEKSNTNPQGNLQQSERKKKLTTFNELGEVTSSSTNSKGKLRRDKAEHCVYCEKNVTNFSRHLIRNHDKEFEVVKITSLPKQSRERKYLLDEIRKRGNFINSYGKEGFINPVRRPKSVWKKKTSDYLPCSGCKGFFTRTYLHRHMKKCYKKSQEADSKHAQAKGFTLLYMSGENNFEDLKLNVFPHMQSDDITKTVMNDFLIKYYGQRYYRCHKEQHLINTVSQRMRELGRFLKTLQNKEPKLSQLADYLKPYYFDELVDATNEMSGYDPDKDTFKSPSLALRWATVLKHVCDIAMFVATKESDAIKHKEIKTLKQMIETQFRFYVSTNANKDLSSKNWKKGSMLPLTEDVIKLNEFVVKEEETWSKQLEDDINNLSYVRNLTEALLAHVILLNRKRSGEAQRITIEDYLRKEDESGVQDIYQSLTVTEKVLVKNIKRFIIRGKKGRAVPVIFTKDMQRHTEILLKSREFVASANPYLFANPSTNDSFLWSYKVLKKLAVACNITNIEAITATCLRKHIATIAQLISMEDNDLEQLSTHLGHEKATHLNYYRKTDDKLQIAKVSKLLLLMETKSMGEYRGKSLANIDFEIPDLDDAEDDISFHQNSKANKPNLKVLNEIRNREDNSNNIQFTGKKESSPRKRKSNSSSIENSGEDSSNIHDNEANKGRVLIPWTTEQKRFAQIFFKSHLTSKKPPRKMECQELKELHPTTYSNKTWAQIKIFIVNQYNKK